jgi:hypothetical protein
MEMEGKQVCSGAPTTRGAVPTTTFLLATTRPDSSRPSSDVFPRGALDLQTLLRMALGLERLVGLWVKAFAGSCGGGVVGTS